MKQNKTLIYVLFAMLVMMGQSFGQAVSPELKKLNRFVQTTSASDSAASAFRAGRDLLEDDKWEAAEEHFRDFIRDYPKNKNVDAALYWLAFTNKKQAHFSEAEKYLTQLFRQYPQSSWLDDARALQIEMALATGNKTVMSYAISTNSVPSIQAVPGIDSSAPAAVSGTWSTNELSAPGAIGIGPAQAVTYQSKREPMSDKDEIKSIALQSLMQSDSDRALPYIAEILKAETSSKPLKDMAVRLLGQHHGPKTTPYLIELARSQNDPKLRRTAIFWLGQSKDEKALALLDELLTKSEEPEIAKAALFAIAQNNTPQTTARLFEVARNHKSTTIRSQAIFWLGQRGEQSIGEVVKLYDSEQNEQVKGQIIFALSQSKSKTALQKILSIAKSDSSMTLRKRAVLSLGQSRDPEASKFLEEILK